MPVVNVQVEPERKATRHSSSRSRSTTSGGGPRVLRLARRVRASEHSILRRKHFLSEFLYEIKPKVLYRSVKNALKFIPRLVWVFFMEVIIISPFRSEWPSKYRTWSAWLALTHDTIRLTNNLHSIPAVSSAIGAHVSRSTLPTDVKKSYAKIIKARQLLDINHPSMRKHNHNLCSRIKINVGGRIFETQLRTIQRYPHTLLGDPNRRLPFFDPIKEYYYFDRSRDCFEYILYYYQSGGRVMCPLHINAEDLLSEVEFFDLGYDAMKVLSMEEGAGAGNDNGEEEEDPRWSLPRNLLQRKIWLLLEYPISSPQATILSLISVYVVLISVIGFIIETDPMLKKKDSDFYKNNDNTMDDDYETMSPSDPLALIEGVCVLWFSLELILRFITCPLKYEFCTDVMNIIDLLAILPFFVGLISNISSTQADGEDSKTNGRKQAAGLEVVRIFRLIRVFRVFKLSRHVKGLKILGWTLRASLNELGLLIFFLIICVILFASAVYIAEEDSPNSQFESIPHSAYWAVTTMTTVGYGDIVPKQMLGKIIGSLCAITGVLTLALPMPVMVSNFNYFYTMELNKAKSATETHDNVHVQMCPYLPNNGKHPDVALLEEAKKLLKVKGTKRESISSYRSFITSKTPRNSPNDLHLTELLKHEEAMLNGKLKGVKINSGATASATNSVHIRNARMNAQSEAGGLKKGNSAKLQGSRGPRGRGQGGGGMGTGRGRK